MTFVPIGCEGDGVCANWTHCSECVAVLLFTRRRRRKPECCADEEKAYRIKGVPPHVYANAEKLLVLEESPAVARQEAEKRAAESKRQDAVTTALELEKAKKQRDDRLRWKRRALHEKETFCELPGWLYVLRQPRLGEVKIGHSRNVTNRIREHARYPGELDLLHVVRASIRDEQAVHAALLSFRVPQAKEWYCDSVLTSPRLAFCLRTLRVVSPHDGASVLTSVNWDIAESRAA